MLRELSENFDSPFIPLSPPRHAEAGGIRESDMPALPVADIGPEEDLRVLLFAPQDLTPSSETSGKVRKGILLHLHLVHFGGRRSISAPQGASFQFVTSAPHDLGLLGLRLHHLAFCNCPGEKAALQFSRPENLARNIRLPSRKRASPPYMQHRQFLASPSFAHKNQGLPLGSFAFLQKRRGRSGVHPYPL